MEGLPPPGMGPRPGSGPRPMEGAILPSLPYPLAAKKNVEITVQITWGGRGRDG